VAQVDVLESSTREDEDHLIVEVGQWEFKGMGYATRGDGWLAAGLATTARAARREMYEDRACEWQRVD
jgi:hypothetical protein